MASMIQTLKATDCEQGRFYRTPTGRLVKITEMTENRKVCIEYWGKYGLGWQSMWLPSDAQLTPAPEFTAFPEPTVSEGVHFGVPEPEAA